MPSCKVSSKTKKLKVWDQKCLIWTFFGLQFRKTLVILEISTLELSKRKVLFKNKKVLNLGSKMPYLGVLS